MAKPAAMRVTKRQNEMDGTEVHLRLVTDPDFKAQSTSPMAAEPEPADPNDEVDDLWDNVPV